VVDKAEAFKGYFTDANAIKVFDTETKKLTDTIAVGLNIYSTHTLSITPNGKKIYFAGKGYTVDSPVEFFVFNTSSKELKKIDFGEDSPGRPLITPNGKYVYINSYSNGDYKFKYLIMDTSNDAITDKVYFPSDICAMTIAPDSNNAYAARISDSSLISKISLKTQKITKTTKVQWDEYDDKGNKIHFIWKIGRINISPDGKYIYLNGTASPDYGYDSKIGNVGIIVLNAKTHKIVKRIPYPKGGFGMLGTGNGPYIAFHPEGSRAYLIGYSYIYVIDTASHTITSTLGNNYTQRNISMAFAPDKKLGYILDRHLGVYPFDPTTNIIQDRIDAHSFYPSSIAIAPSLQYPVIVVPGILGSMSSCLFVDPKSGEACREKKRFAVELIWEDLTPKWILDPIVVTKTYDTLVQELRNTGTPVYEAAYDWRQMNQDTAANTLAKIIEKAKKETGSKQVDIVAHSMGGLVTRSYVELMNKGANIRKLVFIGTPHRGSANSYFGWEGGEFPQFGDLANLLFVDPLITAMKLGYHRPDDETNEVFIRYAIPSMRQLLPADPFLYKRNDKGLFVRIPFSRMRDANTNDLIPLLNANKLVKKLGLDNIQIFAGDNLETRDGINVLPYGGWTQYQDGIPDTINVRVPAVGDGTVPLSSSQLNTKSGRVNVMFVNGEHGKLPDLCKENVVRFLKGEQLPEEGMPLKAPMPTAEELAAKSAAINSSLFVGTAEKVCLGLTTPDGRRFGDFPFETTSVMEVEHPFYLGSDNQTSALAMGNPSAGEYTLNISTRELSAYYKILVSCTEANGEKAEQIIKGTVTRDEVQTLRLNVDGSTVQKLEMR